MDSTEFLHVVAEHKEEICNQVYQIAGQCFGDAKITNCLSFVSNQWKSVTGGHTRSLQKGYKFISKTLLDGNISKEEQYTKIVKYFEEIDFKTAWEQVHTGKKFDKSLLNDNLQKLLDPSESGVEKNVLKHSESAFRTALLNHEIYIDLGLTAGLVLITGLLYYSKKQNNERIKELYQRLENICDKNVSPAINLISKTSYLCEQFGYTNETYMNMTNARIHLGVAKQRLNDLLIDFKHAKKQAKINTAIGITGGLIAAVATAHAAWGFKSLWAGGTAAASAVSTGVLCISGGMILTDLVCGGICFKIAYDEYFKIKEIDKIENTIKDAIKDLENIEKELELELKNESMNEYDLIELLQKLDKQLKQNKELLTQNNEQHKDNDKEKDNKHKAQEKEKEKEKELE